MDRSKEHEVDSSKKKKQKLEKECGKEDENPHQDQHQQECTITTGRWNTGSCDIGQDLKEDIYDDAAVQVAIYNSMKRMREKETQDTEDKEGEYELGSEGDTGLEWDIAWDTQEQEGGMADQ